MKNSIVNEQGNQSTYLIVLFLFFYYYLQQQRTPFNLPLLLILCFTQMFSNSSYSLLRL